MKLLLFPVLALVSLTVMGSSIHHPNCKLRVLEEVNYRGMGEYSELFGPLKGYATTLQEALLSKNKGYLSADSEKDVLQVTLRTSYADIYVYEDSAFDMKKKTSFCYVSALILNAEPIEYYQESTNCKKSLKAVIHDFPTCEISK